MKIKNPAGLCFNFHENSTIKSIEAGPIRINLKEENPYSESGTNIYLRKRTDRIEFLHLLGPHSNSRFTIVGNAFVTYGSWSGFDYTCTLLLSEMSSSWRWQVDIKNASCETADLDLIFVQDISLKPKNSGLINEYYVSQYLERRILNDKNLGSVVCCRQNMSEASGHPWLMMACWNSAASASTDGMQFYGKTYRRTGIPEGLMAESLGGEYAGESSVIALQEKPFLIPAGEMHRSILIATYLDDHPKATSEQDLNRLPGLMAEFKKELPPHRLEKMNKAEESLFSSSPFLQADDLNEQDLNKFFGEERRHAEMENDQLLSFFSKQNHHVVLQVKEIMVDRPHAHILQARAGYTPDENIVSTTCFAFGVFNSHLTQGNTNFNTLLSVCTSQFNRSPETGQRIFVEVDGRQFMLGVPSAYEIGLNHCRWIYKLGEHCFQVRTWTSKTESRVNMDFRVISGKKVSIMLTHHFDAATTWTFHPGNANGKFLIKPGADSLIASNFPQAQFTLMVNSTGIDYKVGGGEIIHPNIKFKAESLFVFDIQDTSEFCLSFIGEVGGPVEVEKIKDAEKQWLLDCRDAQSAWQHLSLRLSLGGDHADVAAIREILPWFGMNALTHFLTPYGLEQFSGAAWGTRDVSQGPIDLLLTMEKYEEAKQILRIIFSNQNPDGGWPQWWMFDRYQNVRAQDSHGDVFYWCMIALSNYIKVTGDLKFLDELIPYYHVQGPDFIEHQPLSKHIDRLVNMIIESFIPGTALVPFGGGDWNDSLQPVSKELSQRMISSWTVEMNYQAFEQYREVYELAGSPEKAEDLKNISERIKSDFNKFLVKDGVVAGYGLLEEDQRMGVLLHPADESTGIRYSILPMERGIISGIFTKEQATHHQELIERHLKGPDGARLMDRPLKYKGGVQEIFQRAESSTFFGREIGLMYVHEHIRYAESLARTGKADAFVKALRQVIPVGYKEIVPCGDFRQSNCYYSSSDVSFKNRYEADVRYDEIATGNILLKGGWRIYSSGPGIFISLIVTQLLGLRQEYGNLIIDPVVPLYLDGLSASIDFSGHPLTIIYTVKENGFGPKSVSVNGKPMAFKREANKFRRGGLVIPRDRFLSHMNGQENIVEVIM